MSKNKSPLKNLVAGASAGAIEAAINYPTEFVKTQLQLQKPNATTGKLPYTGPMDVVRQTVAKSGIQGLYRGVWSLVSGSMFKSGVRFVAYEQYAFFLRSKDGKLTSTATFAAGLLTGTTEALIAVTPAETIKVKLIDDSNRSNPRYRGLVHGTMTIVKEEGIRGIYKGILPTCMRQAVNSGVRFTVYGRVCDLLKSWKTGPKKKLQLHETLGAGVVAGAVNVYVSMPIDVVKTRLQGLQAQQYSGVMDCAMQVFKNEGVLAFWKGTIPRLARVAPSGGIMFTSYEQVMNGLNMVWPEPA